jgi:hypothetical protein
MAIMRAEIDRKKDRNAGGQTIVVYENTKRQTKREGERFNQFHFEAQNIIKYGVHALWREYPVLKCRSKNTKIINFWGLNYFCFTI